VERDKDQGRNEKGQGPREGLERDKGQGKDREGQRPREK